MSIKLKRACLAAVASLMIFCFASCSYDSDAKTIEDIRGTYAMTQFYAEHGTESTSMLEGFEYFYLVISDDSSAKVVFKYVDEEPVAEEYNFTCKYQSGSDELIEEIKVRFFVPHSNVYGGLDVNYLSVSTESRLTCRKFMYVSSASADEPAAINVIRITFEKVSDEYDLKYVEGELNRRFSVKKHDYFENQPKD